MRARGDGDDGDEDERGDGAAAALGRGGVRRHDDGGGAPVVRGLTAVLVSAAQMLQPLIKPIHPAQPRKLLGKLKNKAF